MKASLRSVQLLSCLIAVMMTGAGVALGYFHSVYFGMWLKIPMALMSLMFSVIGIYTGYTPHRQEGYARYKVALRLPRRGGKRQRAPLRIIDAIVKGLWSANTYERVFKPVIADIHHEWRDARRRRERFRAWWIRHVRGRYAVLEVARHQLPWSVWSAIKRLVQLMFTFSK